MAAATASRPHRAKTYAGPSPRSVVLGVAVSLDGYIARPDGSVDWLVMDPDIDLRAYTKSFDVVVAGRKTLNVSDEPKSVANPMGKMCCYIFSRSKPPGKRNGVEYVNRPPRDLIGELQALPGKDIWLMGGGELAREFLREDLVDRLDLGIMPVLLGEGIPLFPPGFPQRDFTLVKFQAYKSGVVMASYARKSTKPPEER